jgi:hypothetical protein
MNSERSRIRVIGRNHHAVRPADAELAHLTQGRNIGSFERSIDMLGSRIRRKIDYRS